LIAQAAHTTLISEQAETAKPSTGSSPKEQKQWEMSDVSQNF